MRLTLLLLTLAAFLSACTRPVEQGGPWLAGAGTPVVTAGGPIPTARPFLLATENTPQPVITPTPDAPHPLPQLRLEADLYTVQAGDTLGLIAQAFDVSLEQLIAANELPNPDLLAVGQVLQIPPPNPLATGPALKIVPDSELVYGPSAVDFNLEAFVQSKSGHLAQYLEEVEGEFLSGAQIVQRVAQNYSVNPRLLLAVLDYRSRWVTSPSPREGTLAYPLGLIDSRRAGLYRQLAWAADTLNRGYYLWRVDGTAAWVLADGSVVPVAPTINAGTAGVQQLFASLSGLDDWRRDVSEQGLLATFTGLFGYPFTLTYEPLLPPGLSQPLMQLPFEDGKTWVFTGGPHGGWDSGSAWAALDFGPPGEAGSCLPNGEWGVAVAAGVIARSSKGVVVVDLDGDGLEQTGWTVLYLHLATEGRVRAGARVQPGDRLGHPSCEGGYAPETHLHLARRYNGEWIPADQPGLPFVMDGWVSSGTGTEYDGFLTKSLPGSNSVSIEAWNGRSEANEISR